MSGDFIHVAQQNGQFKENAINRGYRIIAQENDTE